MPIVLIIILLLLVFGGVGVAPTWGYSQNWGYGPSGLIGVVLIVVLIWFLAGR
jgi:hypothetical protein